MAKIIEEALADRDRGTDWHAGAGLAQGDSLSPERMRRARAAYRSYYRWLRASRLVMAGFLALAALFLLWISPSLPGGLDAAAYPPKVAFTIYLLVATSLMGLVTLVLQERAWRKRQSLMAWSAVYDEATGLHNRTYLFDRLSLECERAERSGGVFSVFVLHIRVGEAKRGPLPVVSNTALERVAELINRLTHSTDLVALLSGSELAVLTIGVTRESRGDLLERLRVAVAEEVPHLLDQPAMASVAGGAATYPADGKEPGALVQAARAARILGAPSRTRAA